MSNGADEETGSKAKWLKGARPLHLLPPKGSWLQPLYGMRRNVTWAAQMREGERSSPFGKQAAAGGGQPTCAAVLVLPVLSVQDQGEHHQQDDDQAGQRHHQEEPPLLVEGRLHLS